MHLPAPASNYFTKQLIRPLLNSSVRNLLSTKHLLALQEANSQKITIIMLTVYLAQIIAVLKDVRCPTLQNRLVVLAILATLGLKIIDSVCNALQNVRSFIISLIGETCSRFADETDCITCSDKSAKAPKCACPTSFFFDQDKKICLDRCSDNSINVYEPSLGNVCAICPLNCALCKALYI